MKPGRKSAAPFRASDITAPYGTVPGDLPVAPPIPRMTKREFLARVADVAPGLWGYVEADLRHLGDDDLVPDGSEEGRSR